MSKSAWQALNDTLGGAGLEYTSLHRVVTAVFISRGCGPDSELLADVTIDRVGEKIAKGENVRSIVAYSKKVAGFVWNEYCRDREKFRNAVRDLAYLNPDRQEAEERADLRRKCQEACLKGLALTERQLLADYYIGGKDRDTLAEEHGLVIATLRTQIHRLKLRLLKCVEDCRRSA